MNHDFSTVRLGLGFVLAGFALQTAVAILAVVILMFSNEFPEDSAFALTGLASLAHLIGIVLCLWTPEYVPRRTSIYFSVALTLSAMLMLVVCSTAGDRMELDPEHVHFVDLGYWAPALQAFAGFVMFLLYLRSLAIFASASHLSPIPTRLLILGAAILATGFFSLVLLLMAAFGREQGLALVAEIGGGGLVAALVVIFIVQYVKLLRGLRMALAEGASRS